MVTVKWRNEYEDREDSFDSYDQYLEESFGPEHSYVILSIDYFGIDLYNKFKGQEVFHPVWKVKGMICGVAEKRYPKMLIMIITEDNPNKRGFEKQDLHNFQVLDENLKPAKRKNELKRFLYISEDNVKKGIIN